MKLFRLLFAVLVCVVPAHADILNIDANVTFENSLYNTFAANFDFDTDTRLVDLESMAFVVDSALGVFTFAGTSALVQSHPTFNWRGEGDLNMVQVNFNDHFNHLLGTPLPIVGSYSYSNVLAFADGQPSRSASSGYINVTNGVTRVPAGDTWLTLALGIASLGLLIKARH